jgi:hypothetical protein
MGGCGCGGSKRSAERVPREQVVRGQRSPDQARGADPGGFKWSGPKRNPKPAAAEPEPSAA